MKAIGFKVQEVANPNTGDISKRIAVAFDNAKVIKLYFGDDKTLDEMVESIKADKQSYLDKVVVREGEYGQYCMFTRATTLEEI